MIACVHFGTSQSYNLGISFQCLSLVFHSLSSQLHSTYLQLAPGISSVTLIVTQPFSPQSTAKEVFVCIQKVQKMMINKAICLKILNQSLCQARGLKVHQNDEKFFILLKVD
ncbi:MAG: hypothetical protein LBQ59_05275 [Candidatus Peribacteria bacterium]|nr:hypothetical protein [Candidatus Peribacteria bacterium]